MPQHDIVSFAVEPIGTDLFVEMFFNGNISPPNSGQPDALVGFVDFDTDQNPATGILSASDFFCPMPAGIGSEFFLNLSPGGASVVDVGAFVVTPIMPTFTATSFSVLIPLAVLGGDDGIVDATTVIGTVPEPTDCAPNGGFITSGDGVPTAGALALALLSLLLLMGGHFVLRRRPA